MRERWNLEKWYGRTAKKLYGFLGTGEKISIRFRPIGHIHSNDNLLDFADYLFFKKPLAEAFGKLAYQEEKKAVAWDVPKKVLAAFTALPIEPTSKANLLAGMRCRVIMELCLRGIYAARQAPCRFLSLARVVARRRKCWIIWPALKENVRPAVTSWPFRPERRPSPCRHEPL